MQHAGFNKSWINAPYPRISNCPGKMNKICKILLKNEVEHRSDFLRLTLPTHRSIGRPTKSYIYQLYDDTGCTHENPLVVINDRE